MADRGNVCVLIPTLNEAATIGDVVDGFREQGFENVLVIDGGSTDGTVNIATDSGARVVHQSGDGGKGEAVRQALDHIEARYVLMLDGDGTYRPEDADRLLEPLFAGEAEHVIGNRFVDMEPGAMSRLNSVGNALIQRAFRFVHRRDEGDILSGYRAFTRESVEQFDLSASGFGIETELSVECVKHGVETEMVPITFRARPEDSETNLRPFRDGGSIFLTLYGLAKTNNPLFYFGSVGALALWAGLGVAGFVGYEWFVVGESHEVLALVSASGILIGILLIMFGVLSDMIVSLHREQQHRIDRLAEQLERERRRTPEDARPGTPDADHRGDEADAVAESGESGDGADPVTADEPGVER
ncbi:TIGR04182 family glycosyltransferase [Halobacteriales archaeon QS_1_68_20]|nr:MAG: TIGR04182 family glycosyltransferase [Halobacteriales archaeon QS_1_68_20]